MRRHAIRLLIYGVVLSLLLAGGGSHPVSAADPDLLQIEQAIREQGLDWTPRAYPRDFALGALPPPPAAPRKAPLPPTRLAALPSSIDWRNHNGNYISAVRNQGDCGSCWAFAAVGAFESLYALDQGTPGSFLDLSEQILVSCDTANDGCHGGDPQNAASFLLSEGTYHESCLPYHKPWNTYCAEACPGWRDSAYKIEAYEPVDRSVEALKQALQDGPLEVCYAVHDDFNYYSSGVYEYSWGYSTGDHAVLLVGYVDVPGSYGGGYFIVKNSWGDDWGEEGFFRIGYSQVDDYWIEFGKWAYRYYLGDHIDIYEPDDSSDQATDLIPGVSQEHTIWPADDADWRRLDLAAAANVVLETSGVPGGDTWIWLYDSSLTQIASNDDYSGETRYSRITTQLPAGTYYVRVECYYDDMVISSYDLSASVTGAASASRALAAGWNLVSVPIVPCHTNPAYVLQSIEGAYEMVQRYDASTGHWQSYDPTLPPDQADLAIDARTGFWVYMTDAGTLTISGARPTTTDILLHEGWNMVGYPAASALTVQQALQSIAGQYTTVYRYDPGGDLPWERFLADAPAWASTMTHLEPGYGYWIDATQACTLTIAHVNLFP